MSAWMVSNRTLSWLTNNITRQINGGYDSFGFDMPSWLREHFEDKSANEIFNELAQMNIDSLEQRYGERSHDMIGELKYYPCEDLWEPREPGAHAWHYQLVKSLLCYLYQCEEGDVPERQLFKELSSYSQMIMTHIVCRNEKYTMAVWE